MIRCELQIWGVLYNERWRKEVVQAISFFMRGYRAP